MDAMDAELRRYWAMLEKLGEAKVERIVNDARRKWKANTDRCRDRLFCEDLYILHRLGWRAAITSSPISTQE